MLFRSMNTLFIFVPVILRYVVTMNRTDLNLMDLISISFSSTISRDRKAENHPLMKVICSLLLYARCLSALLISSFLYFLITVNIKALGTLFYFTSFSEKCSYYIKFEVLPI